MMLQMATFWVNSVYLVVAIFTMFSIALPMASDFVWLFYRVYLGLAMGHFVFLMMNWYGGETAMIEAVGHDTLVNFRVRPCCFCFCCPNAAHLNKRRIRFMQGAVYQMPYIQVCPSFVLKVTKSSCNALLRAERYSSWRSSKYQVTYSSCKMIRD